MAEKDNTIKLESSVIEEAWALGESLKEEQSTRNTLFREMEDIYFMADTIQTKKDDVVVTISPDGKNAIDGGERLLTTMDPVFSITMEGKDDKETEAMEAAVRLMWNRAGMQRQKPPHYDIVHSLLLKDEVHIAISSLNEYAKRLKGNKKTRVEDAMKRSPIAIKVWNPNDGYPYYDDLGLVGYRRSVRTNASKAIKEYGQVVYGILDDLKKKPTDQIDLDIWYDLDSFIIWIGGTVVHAEEWTLPFLPIVVTVGAGSSMYVDGDKNHNPLLYGMNKSGLWKNQNLNMTALYTNLKRWALNPTHAWEKGAPNQDGEKQLVINKDNNHIVEVPYGDTYRPILNKGIIDPALQVGMEIAEKKMEESSIYRTALGQKLGGNAPFSAIALLSQSGRLPLMSTKLMGGVAIAKVMETVLRIYKDQGVECVGIGLSPADIPETFEIEVKLEVDLPQDKLQNANVASTLVDKGMASVAWVQKEILQIENGKQMAKDIWSEKATQLMVMRTLEELSQPNEMAQQGPMGNEQAMPVQRGVPDGQGPMGQRPGVSQPNPQGAQPMMGGAPTEGGLPQVQAGMIPRSGPNDLAVPGKAGGK